MKKQIRNGLILLLAVLLAVSCGVFPGFAEMSGTATGDGTAATGDSATVEGVQGSDGTGTGEPAPEDSIIDTAALDAWIAGYLQEKGITGASQDFSVGFCYTGTGDWWFYNADVFMYSASLYKVPVSMLMAEREAAGELTQDSIVRGTTLQYLESTALTYSNNDSGHAMVDDLGGTYNGKCSDMTIKYTDLPESYFEQDFFDYSYYTARYMTQVMKTLYDGGEEAFPHVVEYLLPAQPDGYFNLTMKGRCDVAQKYGAFEENNGKQNNHCTAILFTPTPIVVTVMTRNVPDFQRRIAEVGSYLADYAAGLDTRLDAYRQEQEAKTAAALAEAAAGQDGADAAGTAGDTTAENAGAATAGNGTAGNGTAEASSTRSIPSQPTGTGSGSEAGRTGGTHLPVWAALVVLLVFLLVLVAATVSVRRQRQHGSASGKAGDGGKAGNSAASGSRGSGKRSAAEKVSEEAARSHNGRGAEKNAGSGNRGREDPSTEKRSYTPRH